MHFPSPPSLDLIAGCALRPEQLLLGGPPRSTSLLSCADSLHPCRHFNRAGDRLFMARRSIGTFAHLAHCRLYLYRSSCLGIGLRRPLIHDKILLNCWKLQFLGADALKIRFFSRWDARSTINNGGVGIRPGQSCSTESSLLTNLLFSI